MTMECKTEVVKAEIIQNNREPSFLLNNNIKYSDMTNEEIESIINYKVEQKVKEEVAKIKDDERLKIYKKQAESRIKLADKNNKNMLKLIKDSNKRFEDNLKEIQNVK